MDSLYIIDASGYLYRSYFAISQMSNKKGVSTNALYGFIRSLLKLYAEFSPTHCVCVFDGPRGTSHRRALYAEYKAHRATTPPDLIDQIEAAKTFCGLFGLPTLCVEGVEADDTMASVALWGAKERNSNVFLCTGDKDMCQLVGDKISLLKTHRDKRTGIENKILGRQEVFQEYGVYPEQILDFLALIGDASDNIPGVKGVGAVTAAKLLEKYGSLEGIYNKIDSLTDKQQQLLRNGKELAYLSKQLATLHTEVPFPHEAQAFALSPMDRPKLLAFCREMDFSSFIRELQLTDQQSGSKNSANAATKIDEATSACEYNIVQGAEDVHALVERIKEKNSSICLHVEYTEGSLLTRKPVGLALCVEPTKAWYIPYSAEIAPEITALLTASYQTFFGHDIKLQMHALANVGILLPVPCFDTMLASYLLNSQQRQHSLDELIPSYFNIEKIPRDSLVRQGRKMIPIEQVSIKPLSAYCCQSADYTLRLKTLQTVQLQQRNLTALLQEIELPVLQTLFSMERRGIYLDKDVIKQLSLEAVALIDVLKEEIFSLAGESFDLNSPKQLREILFNKLKIPSVKKTDTGQDSTDANVLIQLSKQHPIAQKITEYREVEKLRSTYIDPLPQQVNPSTQRIHCTFNQAVAATGRLSCQDPNLQNIPIRSEMGKKIREAFRPQEASWIYLSADYSQLELRLLAHFSKDPTLTEGFLKNEDIHAYTAALVFDLDLADVTPTMRRQAKAVNFGVIYGQQAFGLAQELQISTKEAGEFIKNYFDRYSKVQEYLEECKQRARSTGYSITATGRERFIPDITSKNPLARSAAERLAINTPLQGTAADLIKLAMIEVQRRLTAKELQARMLLQIHDELLLELPDAELSTAHKLLKDSMESVMPLSVPLVVNLAVGKNWKEC